MGTTYPYTHYDDTSENASAMSDTPEDKVEQFLSAPEEVVSDPREAAKLKDRKERDRARKARERAGKRKGKPSLEDILTDVVRVAEDEEHNPHHEFRSVSKRRYEVYGLYPIEDVLQYGRFETVKQMAELSDSVGDRMLLNARSNRTLQSHDRRYIQRYIQGHINKFPELQRATAKAKMGVFISDTHSAFCDPFYWESFLAFAEDAQPDLIGLVADHVDGSEISGHDKVPGFTLPLQVELDLFKAQVTEIRERLGDKVRIVLVGDNHFFDRLTRYLTQVSRALAGLRSLRIDQLMGLGDLDIELAMGGSFVSPEGQEDKRPFIRLWDRFNMTHGTALGKFPAMGELMNWGTSGISGHVHRDQIIRGPVASLRDEQWMCLGSGVIDEVAKYYVKGAGPSWSRAWGIMEMMNGHIQFTSVDVSNRVAMAHGWYYTAAKSLPNSGVQKVRKFWGRRYGLKI